MPEPAELPQVAPELPQVPGGRSERIDAARNRAAILAAAERLLLNHGTEAITMDRLASEAGVGKGTLFRRFGDRAGLFHALLDESERRLQEGFIRGPAPLGPGAPPGRRMIAFGHALLDLTVEHSDLLLAAQPPTRGLRYRSAVYGAHRAHLRALLAQAQVEPVEYLSDALLAALTPDLVVHQLQSGLTVEECKQGWSELVSGVVREHGPEGEADDRSPADVDGSLSADVGASSSTDVGASSSADVEASLSPEAGLPLPAAPDGGYGARCRGKDLAPPIRLPRRSGPVARSEEETRWDSTT